MCIRDRNNVNMGFEILIKPVQFVCVCVCGWRLLCVVIAYHQYIANNKYRYFMETIDILMNRIVRGFTTRLHACSGWYNRNQLNTADEVKKH